MSYELNCNQLMKLGDIRGSLPCNEMAWENPSPENIALAESFSGRKSIFSQIVGVKLLH